MIAVTFFRDRSKPIPYQCAGCGIEWPPNILWTSERNPVLVGFAGDESPDLKFCLCGDCRYVLVRLIQDDYITTVSSSTK